MTDPRLVAASRVEEDAQYEVGLRPRALDDYIGQDRIRENPQMLQFSHRITVIGMPVRGGPGCWQL